MTPLSALLVAIVLSHPSEQTIITVKGAITDLFGDALPGVVVTVETESKRRFSSTTDESGRYRLEIGLPEYEAMTIVAQLPGFTLAQEPFIPSGNDVVWNRALSVAQLTDTPEIKVKGHVRNSAGDPIPGALVTVRMALSPEYLAHAVSDPRGMFTVRGIHDSGYFIATAVHPLHGVGVAAVLLDRSSSLEPAIEIAVRKIPPARKSH